MVTVIPKGSSEKKVKEILRKIKKTKSKIAIENFFGKLPHVEDGLKLQKKIRGEWK